MKRLFIANRGEIALRILRACKDLGIETVAAYTRADKHLLHLRWADRNVCVGRRSYLDGPQMIEAAQLSGCDAVHPGYGFLSENSEFARSVEDAGLTFVGPAPAHIAMMGEKVGARSALASAGLPILPGSDGIVETEAEALAWAREVGYPVMLKASHGGGGRGILLARGEETLVQAFRTISAQAELLFGCADIYLEKYLANARHIEIQVFGDGEGQTVHLGARECSIQRRHQKLLEEAPPFDIATGEVEALAASCCDALSQLEYRNAGTLEFLYADGAFYFLEMNTRIQVEHPVTECVTGIDLVKLQLAVADGVGLGLAQNDIRIQGHAIECRINAEDEYFVPSPGTVDSLQLPDGPGIRVDTHLYAGYSVPHQYDPLVAKVISHGVDRSEATVRMRRALEELDIRFLATNKALHQSILADKKFVSGSYGAGFIDDPVSP
jgi:acetyl-CoA carboxylase, biotin carboxylase subunit